MHLLVYPFCLYLASCIMLTAQMVLWLRHWLVFDKSNNFLWVVMELKKFKYPT